MFRSLPSIRRRGVRAVAALLLLAFAAPAPARVIEGPDWMVCYNRPGQTGAARLEGEFAIRDLLIHQLNRLESGHRAALATFTLSGDSFRSGAAAPILWAVSSALDRGVRVHFAIHRRINRTNEFLPGLSLRRLADRPANPMELSVSSGRPLMHHKIGLFDYGSRDRRVFVGSGNFTGAASMQQWNIAVLLRSPTLYGAYAAELDEFRAGRFNKSKQRTYDRTGFRLPGSWGNSWVRFSPFPDPRDTAETDILALLDAAEEEIIFAMHHFNRPPLRRALVAAANRGLRVAGVIPESDRGTNRFAISGATVRYFANPNLYTGTNRVHLLPARVNAVGPALDSGQPDLVHLKYALVDPSGPRPVVIHGAANWTASGLTSPAGNDESTLFLRHAGIAQAFLEQFRCMTGTATAPPLARHQPGVSALLPP